MGKYRVTIEFDRIKTSGELVKNTTRVTEFFAPSAAEAKKRALSMFRQNEPTRRKIHSVRVEAIEG